MKDITISQSADFLSIALEQIEAENYETAKEFIEYVEEMIPSEEEQDLGQPIRRALLFIDSDDYVDAAACAEDAQRQLVEQL